MMTHTRKQLQRECSRALQAYVQLLEKGCDALDRIEAGAILKDQRHEILSQRKKERLAYAAYTNAQRRLLRFLTDSEPRVTLSTVLWPISYRLKI
jgi:hypothetical protein